MKITEFQDNLPVITTRFIVKEGDPILSVYLDEDGDFQMLGEREADEEDAMILSLAEMIRLDKILLNLPDLQPGSHYIRDEVDQDWVLNEDE